jgi:hypothetical protein
LTHITRAWVVAALAAGLIAGCGTSTSGPASYTTSATSVGPAAPAAARELEPTPSAKAAPAAQVSVFIRAASGNFVSASLSFSRIALVRAKGEPAALNAAPATEITPDAFGLVATGAVPAGKYTGLVLETQPASDRSSISFAVHGKAIALRLPASADLKLEPVTLRADEDLPLVVTLDCAGLTHSRPARTAEHFAAGRLDQSLAAGLKGEVAPSGALARVYACWAKGGAAIASAQADAFSGEYSFADLPPGEYYLRVSAPGHQTYQEPTRTLALAPGKTSTAPAVVLSPSQGFPTR